MTQQAVPVRFELILPPEMRQADDTSGAISPDGQRFVFEATVDGRDGWSCEIWLPRHWLSSRERRAVSIRSGPPTAGRSRSSTADGTPQTGPR